MMGSPTTYLDFDLLIEPGEHGYHIRVIHSPVGPAEADFTLPFSDQDLKMLVLQVFRLSARRSVRTVSSPELKEIRSFGTRLYGAVFDGAIGTCLIRSLDKARSSQAGLRVRIHLDDVPALANVPWEFLYDAGTDDFLCLSDQTPLIRYIDLAEGSAPFFVSPPLRVLTVVSSPSGYPPLDVEKEWQNVNQALQGLVAQGRVAVDRLETPTMEALQQRLRRTDYHILHFIGHGTFDEKREDGVLLFEDLAGKGDPVGAESLGVLLNDHESMRLVLLNACEGARTSATDPFAGTAQSLVRKGIPAVIAMQFEVTDEAAMELSKEFYSSLADGWPIDAALAEARKAVFTRVNAVEWATPVLYMRAPDGRIFDLETPVPVIEPEIEPKPEPKPTRGLEPKPDVEPKPKPDLEPKPKPDVEPKPKPKRDLDRVSAFRRLTEAIRRRPRVGLVAGAALVVVAVAILMLARGGGSGQIAIPDVRNSLSGTASSRLEALGLTVKAVERPSRTVSVGLVTGTSPAIGGRAANGSTVTLFISSGRWIAFETNRDGNGEIYLMRENGSDPINLTRDSAADVNPSWSLDGSKIAFSSDRDEPGNFDIYVIGSDGTGLVRLTKDGSKEDYPAFSPDGQIVFTRSGGGDSEIFVMDGDGSHVRQVTTDVGTAQGPRWSPDGKQLVFFSGSSGRRHIFVVDVAGGTPQNISGTETDDLGAIWSPDGTRIAFKRGGDIWIMDANGDNPTNLTADPADDAEPTWSIDGKQIAFRSNRSGNEDIWVMDVSGLGVPTDLTADSPASDRRPIW